MRIPKSQIQQTLSKHRYWEIFNIACNFICEHHIEAYPIDVFALARKIGIELYSYTYWAAKTSLSFQDLIDRYGKDGFCARYGNRKVIAYNEQMLPQRIRWTIMHEISHLELHLARYTEKPTTLRRGHLEGSAEEAEADLLTRRILAPTCLIWLCNIENSESLANLCNLSRQAADNIFEHVDYKKAHQALGRLECEQRVIHQLMPFIEKYNK